MVHVVERLVFTGHSPNESIVDSADAGVDRPAWRDDGLFLPDDDMASFIRLAHHMENRRFLRHIKVEINFHTALMRMSRHRIPHAACFESGHAHDELAALDSQRMNIFVNFTLVGLRQRTERRRLNVLAQDLGGGIRLMRRSAVEIETGRIFRDGAGKKDFLNAETDIQAIRIV